MASFKSILPFWRLPLEAVAAVEFESTNQELMLDHLIDISATRRMPSFPAWRCIR